MRKIMVRLPCEVSRLASLPKRPYHTPNTASEPMRARRVSQRQSRKVDSQRTPMSTTMMYTRSQMLCVACATPTVVETEIARMNGAINAPMMLIMARAIEL